MLYQVSDHVHFINRRVAWTKTTNQALILTTRPVMLHVAKQILNGEIRNIAALDASPLGRFSRSCSEAARRLLDVISGLRERNMLSEHCVHCPNKDSIVLMKE